MVDVRIPRIAERLKAREPRVLPRAESTRSAAVAAVVRARGDDTDVLLIKRADNPRDPWSGHMAFPGGRHDPRDEDLLATAVRETLEEVGLDLRTAARPVGQLDEIEAVARGSRTGLVIRPYVFELDAPDVTLRRSSDEVAEVLWGRLGPMARGETAIEHRFRYGESDIKLPAYDVHGRTVWGLTYQMLSALFERLR